MPYQANFHIPTPSDDTVIWRYMDLAKFLLMIEEGALYFSSIYDLSDKWEAVIPKRITQMISASSPSTSGELLSTIRSISDIHKVNCWFQGTTESVAMWSLYTSSEFGVAIQSTVGMLKAALADTKEKVYLGMVKYEDHGRCQKDVADISDLNLLEPLLQKRICFKHECELRAITDVLPDLPFQISLASPKLNKMHGILVSVNMAVLIAKIVTGPSFPHWGTQLISSALERASLVKPIQLSSVNDAPEHFFVR